MNISFLLVATSHLWLMHMYTCTYAYIHTHTCMYTLYSDVRILCFFKNSEPVFVWALLLIWWLVLGLVLGTDIICRFFKMWISIFFWLATPHLWLMHMHAHMHAYTYTIQWYVCRGMGMGSWGKQVGSMKEEPQVRGCYNITFICTPTNQETVSVLEKTQANKTFRTWKQM